jgi:hypothetical protein
MSEASAMTRRNPAVRACFSARIIEPIAGVVKREDSTSRAEIRDVPGKANSYPLPELHAGPEPNLFLVFLS